MIKKLNIVLIAAIGAILVLKAILGLCERSASSSETYSESAELRNAAFAPRVHYYTWIPYASVNPLTNRNGYILDVIRAIFPRAVFINDLRDVTDTQKMFEKDPDAVVVCYGDHPALAGIPAAPTPIVKTDIILFTDRANPWRYRGPDSLKELKIGLDADYLDSPVIRAHENKEILPDSFTRAAQFAKIGNGIDALVSSCSNDAMIFADTSVGEHVNYRKSDPIDRVDILFRVSAADPERAKAYIEAYENGWKEILKSGELDRIREYYNYKE